VISEQNLKKIMV